MDRKVNDAVDVLGAQENGLADMVGDKLGLDLSSAIVNKNDRLLQHNMIEHVPISFHQQRNFQATPEMIQNDFLNKLTNENNVQQYS